MDIGESKPPSSSYRELPTPTKRVRKSSLNTLSLNDDSWTTESASIHPVPKPRSSHGAPAISRTIKARKDAVLKSQASEEFEEFTRETGLATLTSSKDIQESSPKRVVKKVEFIDGVHKVSYSPESSDRSKALQVQDADQYLSPSPRSRQISRQAHLAKGSTRFSNTAEFEAFSTGGIQGFNTDLPIPKVKSASSRVTKSVEIKHGQAKMANAFDGQSIHLDDDGMLQPRVPERRKKVSKQVDYRAGKREVTFSNELQESAISGLYDASELMESVSLPIAPERRKKPFLKSVDLKDGQVGYNDDFEEVTLSSLQTPRDEDNTITDTPRSVHMPSKAITIKGGQKTVKMSGELEQFTSGGILKSLAVEQNRENEQETVTLKPVAPVRPSRKVDLNRSLKGADTQKISNDFDTLSRTLDVDQSETFVDESTAVNKSKDKEVTSWVEFREGKRHVRHSDEIENWSLGTAMEYRHQQAAATPGGRGVHKQVDYSEGKRQVRYSDDFQNTMEYTDDFEGSSASWAVKVPTSPRHGRHSKHVELRDGRHHVAHSGEFSQRLTESVASDYSQSLEEVTVEDMESYSEHFDSLTLSNTSLRKSRSLTSVVPYTLAELTESSISTQTPITSIQSSIHTSIPTSIRTSIQTSMPVDQERSAGKTTRTSQLYTESFESTGLSYSQTHSQAYSDTWESDFSLTSSLRISPKYRRKLGIERLDVSESEDDYTMSFTQSTAREGQKSGSSESLAERQAAVRAMDSFVKQKVKTLKGPQKPNPQPELKEEKLEGAERNELKKFLKKRLAVLQEKKKADGQKSKEESKERCPVSASCQLRGLSEKENIEGYGISPLMIGRLKAENTLANMKKAANTKVHNPHKCKHCRVKVEEQAAAQFMWHKRALVSEKLVQEKMEMQMLQLQDPMWLYAEALRGLPKVTDDPDDVYYKLMRPLFDTYAGKYKETLAPS